jgi:hypothetical protein
LQVVAWVHFNVQETFTISRGQITMGPDNKNSQTAK